MTWTAIVPIKGSGQRKTRLSSLLDEGQRQKLSDRIFHHVLAVLESCPDIAEIIVLSDVRPGRWQGRLCIDCGHGLNDELKSLSAMIGNKSIAVMHADLPLLSSDDVSTLLTAALDKGGAIAPDRHGSGTNAIALRNATGFHFAFGPNSFARHCAAASGSLEPISKTGLTFDIDTPEDFALLAKQAPAITQL